jgi:hypothetical protein
MFIGHERLGASLEQNASGTKAAGRGQAPMESVTNHTPGQMAQKATPIVMIQSLA